MADSIYKVKVTGEGVSVEREVSKDVGDQVVMLILTGRTSTQAAPVPKSPHKETPSTQVNQDHTGGRRSSDLSIRETLDASGAKRAPDKITVIGNYVRETESKDFNRDDIVQMYEAAAEKVPSNLARDIKWTLKAGWIAERNDSKGSYYVTNTGHKALEAKFSKEFVSRTRGMYSGKKPSDSSDGKK